MYFPDIWGLCIDNEMKEDTIYCRKSFELELKKRVSLSVSTPSPQKKHWWILDIIYLKPNQTKFHNCCKANGELCTVLLPAASAGAAWWWQQSSTNNQNDTKGSGKQDGTFGVIFTGCQSNMLSVLCSLSSSLDPAEMQWPTEAPWDQRSLSSSCWCVVRTEQRSCGRWKWTYSELLFSAAASWCVTSLLVCSYSCLLLLFHWNTTTGNCSCHNQSIKKLHLDYTFWSFPTKMTQILAIVRRPCQEENSLFVPTSAHNKVGMVTLVKSALEPERSESKSWSFLWKTQFWVNFHPTYLMTHSSSHQGATVMPWLHSRAGWL